MYNHLKQQSKSCYHNLKLILKFFQKKLSNFCYRCHFCRTLQRDPPEHGATGGEDDGEREEESQGEEEHVVGDIRGLQQHK